jgi:hypothetical protein
MTRAGRKKDKKPPPVRKVYIVVHHEIFQTAPSVFWDDEMVFYVVSSLATAIDHIKKNHVEPHSWWEILEQTIDSHEWPTSLGHYSRRGAKLKSAPHEKAVVAFKKCKADPTHHLNPKGLKRILKRK